MVGVLREPAANTPASRRATRASRGPSTGRRPSCAVLMHVPRERLHVIERRLRKNAVTEIEHMTRTTADARQDVVCPREQAIQGAEQERRIQIPLDAPIGADSFPGPVDR